MITNKLINATFLFFLFIVSAQASKLRSNFPPFEKKKQHVFLQIKTSQNNTVNNVNPNVSNTNSNTNGNTNGNSDLTPKLLPGQSLTFENGEQKYFAIGQCNSNNCKSPYGKCTSDQVCECSREYGHELNQPSIANNLSCSLPLKQQATFFFLELFFWVGIGHFYAGRIIYGIIKLLLIIIVIILDCLIKRLVIVKRNYKTQKIYNICMWIMYLCILIFQTFDITMIGLNKFSDGNGFMFRTWDNYY
jgi:hypothetical protein